MIHVSYCHVYLDTHYDRDIFIDLLKKLHGMDNMKRLGNFVLIN